MERCETCENWYRYDGPVGSCKAVKKANESKPAIAQISVISGAGSETTATVYLETKADFGCVLHKEKT